MNPQPENPTLKWEKGMSRHPEITQARQAAAKQFRGEKPVSMNSVDLLRSTSFGACCRKWKSLSIRDAQGRRAARGKVVSDEGTLASSGQRFSYHCGILGGTTTFEEINIEINEGRPPGWHTPSMLYWNGEYVATSVWVRPPVDPGLGWFRRLKSWVTQSTHTLFFRDDKQIGCLTQPWSISTRTQIFLEIDDPPMKLPINPMKSSWLFANGPKASREYQAKAGRGYRDLVIPMESPRPKDPYFTILHFLASVFGRSC